MTSLHIMTQYIWETRAITSWHKSLKSNHFSDVRTFFFPWKTTVSAVSAEESICLLRCYSWKSQDLDSHLPVSWIKCPWIPLCWKVFLAESSSQTPVTWTHHVCCSFAERMNSSWMAALLMKKALKWTLQCPEEVQPMCNPLSGAS